MIFCVVFKSYSTLNLIILTRKVNSVEVLAVATGQDHHSQQHTLLATSTISLAQVVFFMVYCMQYFVLAKETKSTKFQSVFLVAIRRGSGRALVRTVHRSRVTCI